VPICRGDYRLRRRPFSYKAGTNFIGSGVVVYVSREPIIVCELVAVLPDLLQSGIAMGGVLISATQADCAMDPGRPSYWRGPRKITILDTSDSDF
jgi:hypothetical protein